MDLRTFAIIFSFSVASTFAGATAQNPEGDILSGLIKSVNSSRPETSPSSGPNLSAVQAEYAGIEGVLSSVEGDGKSGAIDYDRVFSAMNPMGALSYITGDAETGDALSYIIGAAGQRDAISYIIGGQDSWGTTAGLPTVLNYLTNAYSGNSFYQTGFWGEAGSIYSSATYQGPMPVFDESDFYRPVMGVITSRYGYRPSFGRIHHGVDLSLSVGDTVRAALPGIVSRVSYDAGGYGNYVVMAHSNGVETRYGHLSGSLVYPGQRVEAGEPIALGGNTGNSTGPHLHFETRYMGTPVDPLTVFDFSGRSMNLYAAKSRQNYAAPGLATGFNGTKTSLKEKSTYVVRQGDTVKKIADRAGISVLRLCQLNFITESQQLQPGTMLRLK